MAKTPAAKKNVPKPAAKEALGADAAAAEKQGAPTGDQDAGVSTDPPASTSTEAGTESAPPASSDADAEAAATAAAAVKLDSVLSGHPVTSLDVTEGADGVVTADPASEIQATTETRVSGWVVECKRARGIWRAGRFWPPVPTAVSDDELTDEQLTALQAEPLLSVVGVE